MLDDRTDRLNVTLGRAGRADVTVTLMKGMSSTGGGVQSGGADLPFASHVQEISVTRDGVSWR
jgi:hypothetical protein